MVSAAKLRRAQERALAARPYAKMITSVLESLTRRVDIIDPETGNLRHPLFAARPEKRVLLIIISGDKGFAGAFNSNILKTAFQFLAGNTDKEIDVEAVGRKGRDMMRRRHPARRLRGAGPTRTATPCRFAKSGSLRSKSRATIRHAGKLEAKRVFELAQSVISRYVHEEIDAAYIVYNEFKSVIAQRLVVERLLPIMKIGIPQITGATEPTEAEKERAAEAALSAGITLEPIDTAAADEEAKKFGTRAGGLHLRAAGRGAFERPVAAIRFFHAVSRHDGVGCGGACGSHDSHGLSLKQRL